MLSWQPSEFAHCHSAFASNLFDEEILPTCRLNQILHPSKTQHLTENGGVPRIDVISRFFSEKFFKKTSETTKLPFSGEWGRLTLSTCVSLARVTHLDLFLMYFPCFRVYDHPGKEESQVLSPLIPALLALQLSPEQCWAWENWLPGSQKSAHDFELPKNLTSIKKKIHRPKMESLLLGQGTKRGLNT